jgi:hypothetical protein
MGRIELPTYGLWIHRSHQLSYITIVKNIFCNFFYYNLVCQTEFESASFSFTAKSFTIKLPTRLYYYNSLFLGRDRQNRTADREIMSLLLYLLSYITINVLLLIHYYYLGRRKRFELFLKASQTLVLTTTLTTPSIYCFTTYYNT